MKLRITVTAATVLFAVGIAAGALFFSGALTSRAVQNPTFNLDMIPTGNTYDEGTNSMAVGATDQCLTTAVANTISHLHASHLVIHNVEDLTAFQVRLN